MRAGPLRSARGEGDRHVVGVGEVGGDGAVPDAVRVRVERVALEQPGEVNQRVSGAAHLVQRLGARRRRGEVGVPGREPRRAEFPLRCGKAVGVDVDQQHMRAGLQERARRGAPDAASAAGDGDAPSGEGRADGRSHLRRPAPRSRASP
jgi:hypothetical protein